MDTQQLTDLVRILVWPVALVVLAIVFRQPLARLVVTVTQLRFRDLEIDFGRELEKLESKLPPEVGEAPASESAASQSVDRPAAGLAAEAASAQPLAGVLLASTALEARVKARQESDHPPDLSADLEGLIHGLSDLSAAAAGGRIKSGTVSAEQAGAYIRLVERASAWLDSLS